MIMLTYLHGLRASEVVALTVNNLRDGHLTVLAVFRPPGSLAAPVSAGASSHSYLPPNGGLCPKLMAFEGCFDCRF